MAGSSAFIAATGSAVVAGAGLLLAVRYLNGTPGLDRNAEGAVAGVAFAALLATPGVLALLALRGRPALLLPAAVVLMPLSMVSMAGVTLPLLLPAVMLVVAYERRAPLMARPVLHPALITLVTMALLVAAGIALFAHQDPRSYETATSGGSTSDVVTYVESMIALAVVGCALATAWWASSPRS